MTILIGKRVLVTRPRAQSEEFIKQLVELGAVPIEFPTIEISPLEDTSELDHAIQSLGSYHWIIFTSVNGVAAFWNRLEALRKENNAFNGLHVAAIGPATAQALLERGIEPDFIPAEFVAEAIAPGLGQVSGQRILLPRAEIARKALIDELQAQGAVAEEISVYRTVPTHPDPQAMAELEKGIDIATFTSSSTVRNFFGLLGERAGKVLEKAVIACIGPITANTARELGLAVDIIAKEYTVDGLIEALLSDLSPQ